MPFQSEKQRRFLHANHPEIAKRWEKEYATGGISNHFRRRLGLKKGSGGPGPGGQGARGQATQNPGSSGGPPGGGGGGQGGNMYYQAPTPTYQNVHQTGAISQTPGNIPTLATSGGPKPHSGPSFAEIQAQKKAALEKKNLAAWEHSQTLKQNKKERIKKTKYLQGLLKNDPLYDTYVDRNLVDWSNIKTYDDDIKELIANPNIQNKGEQLGDLLKFQSGAWGYTTPWSKQDDSLYIADVDKFDPTWTPGWTGESEQEELNKRIAETIGHEARHQVLGEEMNAPYESVLTNEEKNKIEDLYQSGSITANERDSILISSGSSWAGDPYSQKVNKNLNVSDLPGTGTHELVNTMGDFQAYNDPTIYNDIYGTIHGGMPRHLSSPVADQLYDASKQFTKDTKARHEGQKYENIDPVMVEGLKRAYPQEDVEQHLKEMSTGEAMDLLQEDYNEHDGRDYTGRAVEGNEYAARLSKTQTKDLKPSKMYSTSDMKVAYEKAQNMNANQFKAWAKKEGQTGEYIDKLSSALNYNETSAGKVDMIGKDATKMLDLPGLGDDKQELKNAAATLLGIVETSANKDEWTTQSDVKLSLANDFYNDKEKYEKLGIDNPDDLKEFIEVVLKDKKAKGGLARKNYYHGGILDINASEEIISDDGNDIELTDYNAAFDDPKDLSTGVKTLFQAKDGGRIGYANGPPGGGETSLGSGAAYSGGASDRGPRDAPDRHGPTTETKTTITGDGYQDQIIQIAEDTKKTKEKREQASKQGWHQFITPRHITPTPKEKSFLDKLAWGIGAYVTGGMLLGYEVPKGVLTAQKFLSKRGDIKMAIKAYNKLVGTDYDLDEFVDNQVKNMKESYKERKAKMDEYKSLPKGHPDRIALEVELEIGKKPDNLGDDGGSQPTVNPITLEVDEEYAQGDYDFDSMSNWNAMKQKQGLNAALQEKWAEEQEAYDQSFLVANSGGLANLFRVKNQ